MQLTNQPNWDGLGLQGHKGRIMAFRGLERTQNGLGTNCRKTEGRITKRPNDQKAESD